jgi:hypothetical protein
VTAHLVKAGGGGDALIWLVLAIIWVVAQIVSQTKRGRSRPPTQPASPPRAPQRTFNDDLKQIMESLLQQNMPPADTQTPLPPIPYAGEAEPAPAATPRATQTRARPRHHPAPARAKIPAPPAAPPPRRIPLPAEAMPPIPKTSASKSAVSLLRVPTVRVRGLSLPAMGTATGIGTRAPRHQKMFKGRQALRNAVINRIVLGPPRAMA